MAGSSYYVLRNTALGNEYRFRALPEALAAVSPSVGNHDHWVIFEITSGQRGYSAELIAHGCGHEVPAPVGLTRQPAAVVR